MPKLTFEEQLLQESGLFVFTNDCQQTDQQLLEQDDSIFAKNAHADKSDLNVLSH